MDSGWERAAADYHRNSESELHRLEETNQVLQAEVWDLTTRVRDQQAELADLRGRLERAHLRTGAQAEIITDLIEGQRVEP